jgi:hypothetical protein
MVTAPALYSRCPRFESVFGVRLTGIVICGFRHFLQTSAGLVL